MIQWRLSGGESVTTTTTTYLPPRNDSNQREKSRAWAKRLPRRTWSGSAKGHDLRRDARYAIHCSVSDTSGDSGEFAISGRAHSVHDPQLRSLAAQLAPYTPADRYVLFEFDVESASSTVYQNGEPVRTRWKRRE